MATNEALARCREWLGAGRTALTQAQRLEIRELYERVTGRTLRRCNCPDLYRDAVFEIYHKLKNNGQMAQKSNYRLKNGVVIRYKGMPYTHVNLTDEVAEAYLKENPAHSSRFDVIPSKEAMAKAEKEASTVKELKAELKEAKAKIKQLEGELKKAKAEETAEPETEEPETEEASKE